jgi:hypothetical protein
MRSPPSAWPWSSSGKPHRRRQLLQKKFHSRAKIRLAGFPTSC